MKAAVKAIFISVGLVLILIALGLIAAASQGDKLVRYQVERALSHALKTAVTVESTELDFPGETVTLRNLVVENPAGFPEGPAMTLARVEIALDARSLLTDDPRLRRIDIEGALVKLRYDAAEGSNLGALLRESERTALERESRKPQAARRRYRVDELRCENARVEFGTDMVPGIEPGLDVAPFTLTELSQDQPVTPGQIGAIFIRSLLREAVGFRGLLRPIATFLRDELDRLME